MSLSPPWGQGNATRRSSFSGPEPGGVAVGAAEFCAPVQDAHSGWGQGHRAAVKVGHLSQGPALGLQAAGSDGVLVGLARLPGLVLLRNAPPRATHTDARTITTTADTREATSASARQTAVGARAHGGGARQSALRQTPEVRNVGRGERAAWEGPPRWPR